MVPAPAPDQAARAELKARLADRWWRLNNLYWIQDKDGQEILFRPNEQQAELDDGMHNRNIVLKSRQHGFTTYACIRALDMALFRSNTSCGIVFHKKEDAVEKFRTKILFAYDRLPAWLKAERPMTKRNEGGTAEFKNGSRIACSTSHRGGTLQYLHVSEYGPMCSMFPLRADEVASGALNAVAVDGIVTIESTAMGAWGDYYDRCQTAMALQREIAGGTAQLSKLDYKLFFFAWWQDKGNVLDPRGVVVPPDTQKYFEKIEAEMGCKLSPRQRAWYVKKVAEQKDKMLREHPSSPAEAFRGSIDGAYYAHELAVAEAEGRVCDLPFHPSLPVFTFWDIGRNDSTGIWFMQEVGPWLHFIRYYENNGQGAAHYANVLTKFRDELGYRYGTHFLPHDAGVSDWSQGDNRTRREVLEDLNIGEVEVVQRIENLNDGIEMTRQMLARCKFDKTNCGENPVGSGRGGLPALRAYRRVYDPISDTWSFKPVKSWANHGSDAIRQCAQGFEGSGVSVETILPAWKQKLIRQGVSGRRRNPATA